MIKKAGCLAVALVLLIGGLVGCDLNLLGSRNNGVSLEQDDLNAAASGLLVEVIQSFPDLYPEHEWTEQMLLGATVSDCVLLYEVQGLPRDPEAIPDHIAVLNPAVCIVGVESSGELVGEFEMVAENGEWQILKAGGSRVVSLSETIDRVQQAHGGDSAEVWVLWGTWGQWVLCAWDGQVVGVFPFARSDYHTGDSSVLPAAGEVLTNGELLEAIRMQNRI